MPAGLSFGEALDEALLAATAPTVRLGIATMAIMTGPLPLPPYARPAYGSWASPPRPPRRHQPRTREERDAFERLQAVGAGLVPSFTADELRRAFRRLARELHPDRHLDLTTDERARLGQRFAAVRDDYLVLRRAISA